MSDVVEVNRRATQINVSPQFDNYSKVIIHVSDETTYESGNDTGRTLEIDNPFGTQTMADNILQSLMGYQYQPSELTGALLNPAAEMGDAVNARGTYFGIYTRERTFGRLMKADVSAPCDEEINHEYQFESPERREFKRSIDEVKASLFIGPNSIVAQVERKVGETGGDSSFGWELTDTAHKWYSNGQEVMSVSVSGLKVTGEVQATTGKIGGFNISASAIWNNISSLDGSQSKGVYIGTDGIRLGQNFKVNRKGEATATKLTVDTLIINGSDVSAATLNTRANNGNSAFSWTTSNGSYCTGGAYWGYKFDNATDRSPSYVPSYFTCGTLTATSGITTNGNVLASYGSGYFGSLKVGSYFAEWKSKTINGTTIFYLGR